MHMQTGIFGELLDQQRDRLASEFRSSLENPQTPLSYPAEWLLDIFNGGRTDSGIRVSEMTAFQCTAFLACVDFISGMIASLPKHVFERKLVANGRASHRIAYDHNYYDLINIEPNEEMSRFVFDKAFMAHVLAWGNGYAEIQRDAGNAAVAIWPRNPYKTLPYRMTESVQLEPVAWRPFPVVLRAGDLVYKTTDSIDGQDNSNSDASLGNERIIPREDMLHLPGLSFDGRIGQNVVWLARQVLGLALATEKFGAKYFANFARPSGILEGPALSGPAKEEAKKSWMEAQGGENSHRVAFLPPGFKFTPISNKPEESQMTESEEKQGIKVASLFHLPPRVIGYGAVTSRNNSEQEAQEIICYALSPWTNALKLEYKRKLFPNSGLGRTPRNAYFIDFDYTDLQRADSASREKFYASGRQWAYLNTNDIRAFEKLNPIEEAWAEDYWMPINMTLAQTPIDPNSQDGAGNGDKSADEGDDPVTGRYIQHYSRMFRDALGRVLARDKRDLKVVSTAFTPVLLSIRDGVFDLAAIQLRLHDKPGAESERFVADYVGGLAKRAASWTAGEADNTAAAELRRAIRALRVAAYREAASLKAKTIEGETDAD